MCVLVIVNDVLGVYVCVCTRIGMKHGMGCVSVNLSKRLNDGVRCTYMCIWRSGEAVYLMRRSPQHGVTRKTCIVPCRATMTVTVE